MTTTADDERKGWTPRSIPEGQREEYGDYAWELWAAQSKSTRMIAEQILKERKVSVSHVTVAQLVKEGRARHEMPSRSEAAVQVDTAARYVIAQLYEERRAGAASMSEIAPSVLKALERLARLHGADAPTRVHVQDDRPAPAPDPVTAAQVAALIKDAERQVEQLRNGEGGP